MGGSVSSRCASVLEGGSELEGGGEVGCVRGDYGMHCGAGWLPSHFPSTSGHAASTPSYTLSLSPMPQVALWGAALIVFVFANFVKLQVG